MKIAVVSGFIPYPSNFGGALDVWERIKGLVALGHEVDLIATDKNHPTQQQIDAIKLIVKDFYFVQRKNKIQQLFRNLPLQFLSRMNLANVVVDKSYDVIILESEFCWPITLNNSVKYKKIVIRVHNIENYYFKMLGKSSTSIKEKIYYMIEVAKIKKFSPLIFDKVDRLWFISKDDLEHLNYKFKSIFMPYPINEPYIKPEIKEGNHVVFMGSLFMQNNIYGLRWYLKNVHPLLCEKYPKYHFYIVGSLKEDDISLKEELSSFTKCTLVVNTTHLYQFYNKAQVFVNPMFHGSGVKVKSVNALVNGVPLVSTQTGVEGIGLNTEMYYHAQTVSEFIQAIDEVFSNRLLAIERTLKAQNYLKNIYYLDVLKNELNALK